MRDESNLVPIFRLFVSWFRKFVRCKKIYCYILAFRTKCQRM